MTSPSSHLAREDGDARGGSRLISGSSVSTLTVNGRDYQGREYTVASMLYRRLGIRGERQVLEARERIPIAVRPFLQSRTESAAPSMEHSDRALVP